MAEAQAEVERLASAAAATEHAAQAAAESAAQTAVQLRAEVEALQQQVAEGAETQQALTQQLDSLKAALKEMAAEREAAFTRIGEQPLWHLGLLTWVLGGRTDCPVGPVCGAANQAMLAACHECGPPPHTLPFAVSSIPRPRACLSLSGEGREQLGDLEEALAEAQQQLAAQKQAAKQ